MASLSIVICTFDRYRRLKMTLEALDALSCLTAYETIVVDNTADEEQRRIFRAQCADRFGSVICVESTPPGLSRARNVGLNHASGDAVAFLDDDAVPGRGWPESLAQAFDDTNVVFAGGPIEPDWEIDPPRWLPQELIGVFTVLNHGTVERNLHDNEFFYGANFAVRRDVAKQMGGFDESLGRVGKNLQGDEDIEIQRRLKAIGTGRYVPSAAVKHFVPYQRLSIDWLVRRMSWQGASETSGGNAGLLDHQRSLVTGSSAFEEGQRLLAKLGTAPSSSAEALARLNFMRGFCGLLLNSAVPLGNLVPNSAVVGNGESINTARPSPCVSSLADFQFSNALETVGKDDIVFCEFGAGHGYLFESFGGLRNARMVQHQGDPWSDPSRAVKALESVVAVAEENRAAAVVMLTLDWLAASPPALDAFAPSGDIPIIGILHRTDIKGCDAERVAQLRARFDRILLLSDTLERHYASLHGSAKLATLWHPSLFQMNRPLDGIHTLFRSKRGKPRHIASLLGEIRPGKGHEFVVGSLLHAPSKLTDRLQLSIIGGGYPREIASLRRIVERSNLCVDMKVRERSASDHRGVSGAVFAKEMEKASIMIFGYTGNESLAVSGHLVDGVFSGARILCATQSIMSETVEKYQIGSLFDAGIPSSLIHALSKEIEGIDAANLDEDALRIFHRDFNHDATLEALRMLVGRFPDVRSLRPEVRYPRKTHEPHFATAER